MKKLFVFVVPFLVLACGGAFVPEGADAGPSPVWRCSSFAGASLPCDATLSDGTVTSCDCPNACDVLTKGVAFAGACVQNDKK